MFEILCRELIMPDGKEDYSDLKKVNDKITISMEPDKYENYKRQIQQIYGNEVVNIDMFGEDR